MPSERARQWKARSAVPSYLRDDVPDDVRKEVEEFARTPPEGLPVVRLPGDYATEELLLADVEVAVRKARLLATGSEEPPLAGSSVSPKGSVTSPWDHNGAMDAFARFLSERTTIPYEDLYRWMHTGERPSVAACTVDTHDTRCDPEGESFTVVTLRFTRPPTARELETIRKAMNEALGPKARLTAEQQLLRRVVDSTLSEEERRGYERDAWERVGRRMVEYGGKRKIYRSWAEQYRRSCAVLDNVNKERRGTDTAERRARRIELAKSYQSGRELVARLRSEAVR